MEEPTETLKVKGPSTNKYLQQKNPVRQLVFTHKCVIFTLLIVGISFLSIGIACAVIESTVTQVQHTYVDAKSTKALCQDVADKPCLFIFDVKQDIKGPVYFYYTLTNFYQNHRRYVPSRSDIMARGSFGMNNSDDASSVVAKCQFADIAYKVDDVPVYYYPCGLVARSMMNDTFALQNSSGVAVNWTQDGVSIKDGSDSKYRSKDEAWLRENCYSLGEYTLGEGHRHFDISGFAESLRGFQGTRNVNRSRYHCWHNISDEGFRVWSRTAATSSFWKLHRVIPGGLVKGTYSLVINVRFPVTAFGGTKGFALTNATPLGTKRAALSVVYLVMGCVSIVTAFVFLVMKMLLPRAEKPEPMYRVAQINAPKEKSHEPEMHACIPNNARIYLPMARRQHAGISREIITPYLTEDGAKVASPFASNFVSTSKYTMFTFVPLNLMLQFQRFANVYFLTIAILASINAISPMGGSTFWLPLITVLSFTALKDGVEDYRRHVSDIEENSRVTEVCCCVCVYVHMCVCMYVIHIFTPPY
jgi:hypothetical protein